MIFMDEMNFREPIQKMSGVGKNRPGRASAHKRSRWRGAVVTLLAAACGLALSEQRAYAQSDQVGEYELKAAILYNLSKFVEWPSSAYADAEAPTVLCTLGKDPFGDFLNLIEQKRTGNSRAMSVRRLKNQEGIRDCHMLYISTSERKTVTQILSRLKGSSVLTVGEMSQFAAHGGIIQFTLEDKQVRFEFNLDAASRMTLKINSRLLALGRIVKDQSADIGKTGELTPAASVAMPAAKFPASPARGHAAD